MASKKALKITWVRSTIACTERQRRIVRGLGFRKLRQTVERPDTPEIRGMLAKVAHLVTVSH